MKRLHLLLLFGMIVLIFQTKNISAQGMLISDSIWIPDPKAMLDIKSQNKGLLIPRVDLLTSNIGTGLGANQMGLLVFNTNANFSAGIGFYYWTGIKWLRIFDGTNATSNYWSKSIERIYPTDSNYTIEYISKDTLSHDVMFGKDKQGTEIFRIRTSYGIPGWVNRYNLGIGAGCLKNNTTGALNTACGWESLINNTTGYHNTAIGQQVLFSLTTGHKNTAIGVHAGYGLTTGYSNNLFGLDALVQSLTGNENSAFGDGAMWHYPGDDGSCFGFGSLYYDTSHNASTAFGAYTLHDGYNVGGSIAFGYRAGMHATQPNQAWIGNGALGSDSTSIFIWGDMMRNFMRINDSLYIKYLPTVTSPNYFITQTPYGSLGKTPATSFTNQWDVYATTSLTPKAAFPTGIYLPPGSKINFAGQEVVSPSGTYLQLPNIFVNGYITAPTSIQQKTLYWASGNQYIRNKADNGWLSSLDYDATGNEAVMHAVNFGRMTAKSRIRGGSLAADSITVLSAQPAYLLAPDVNGVVSKYPFTPQDFSGKAPFESNPSGGRIYLKNLNDKTGLGTSTPEAKLEINGSLKVDSCVYFAMKDNGNSGTTLDVNWKAGNIQKITRTGNCTINMTAPPGATRLTLLVNHENSSEPYTLNFSPVPKWPGGVAPSFTNTADGIDIINFVFDGIAYYATVDNDFK